MTAMATIQKINGIKQTWHTIEFSNNHPPNKNPTKSNQLTQTKSHHSTPQDAARSTNLAYQQALSKVKSANIAPNHTPATEHNTPNAPHSQPARSQNQPTGQLSKQHEVQQLKLIN